ncbi:hypothetical protein TNCV_1255041 [Trichonephila clavipes]|nr:hypothetical protein TNCV_1255041 [Trichonephila clavipes]
MQADMIDADDLIGVNRLFVGEKLTLHQCLSRNTEETYHQPIDMSGFTPASRLQRSVGQRERRRNPQDTIFHLTGCRTRQTCGLENQQC